jgi:integrase
MGVYKRGKHWWVDFYVDGVRVRQNTKATSKQNALDVWAKARAEAVEGKFDLQRVKRSATLEDFAGQYLEHSEQNKKPSTYERDCMSIKHLKAYFGKRQLRNIKPMLIEHYRRKRLEEGRAPATVNREVGCLRHLMTIAANNGLLLDNSAKRVRALREDNEIVNPFTDEDEALVLANTAPHIRDIAICAFDTGMRRGEILNLEWSNVDLARRTIRVEKTKTDKWRDIPITARLMEVLTRLHKDSQTGYVFPNPRTGGKLTKVSKGWRRAIERAGLADKGYRFHDCRGTFITRLVEEGESLITIKQLSGHTTTRMLERYARPGERSRREAIAALDRRRQPKTPVDFEAGRASMGGKSGHNTVTIGSRAAGQDTGQADRLNADR